MAGQLVRVLLWCAVLNMAVLLAWAGMFIFKKELMYGLHSCWFKLSPEQFDALHYGGMAFYKLLIIFFNIVPLLAVWMSSCPCAGR